VPGPIFWHFHPRSTDLEFEHPSLTARPKLSYLALKTPSFILALAVRPSRLPPFFSSSRNRSASSPYPKISEPRATR